MVLVSLIAHFTCLFKNSFGTDLLSLNFFSSQARNFMRDQMKIGDLAFFYHSNCKEPGIVGVMEVTVKIMDFNIPS